MRTEQLRRRARELWSHPYLQRAWVRSVLQLGDKWILHPSHPVVKWGSK